MVLPKTHAPGNVISSCIMLVMVLAFAMKAVLPAGFMPVIGKDGLTEIVICSGMGEKTVLVPSENAPQQDGHKDKGEVCAYQAVASQKNILPAPVLLFSPPILKEDAVQVYDDETPASFLSTSNTARGPPTSV